MPTLLAIATSLTRHRYLIGQLAWREISGRYRGSAAGLLWSFVTPLVMLAVYTLVFGVIFQARWTGIGAGDAAAGQSRADFALILFVGLILHGFLGECVTRAPALVLGNANLVKRVVFPLEILGWSTIASALFHGAVSFAILIGVYAVLHGGVPWTALLLPLVIGPLVLVCLGLVWFLAAAGVFLRDIGQMVGPVTTVLLFLSPILFPVDGMPEPLRTLIVLNPLTVPVEQARNLLIWGLLPDWGALALHAAAALGVAWAGLYWFRRCRPAFADVL